MIFHFFFFFQAEDGIRDGHVTGVQTCALPISPWRRLDGAGPRGLLDRRARAWPEERPLMQRYRDLRVWRESHAFLLGVYRVTAELPSEEKYGLTSQLRRAAVSVPTNIVEGARRQGRQDYVRFLNLAEASLAEAEYLLIVTVDLQYLSLDAVQPLLGAAGRIARKLYLLRSMVERFT